MRYAKYFLLTILTVTAVLSPTAACAQDESGEAPNPLLDVLTRVPYGLPARTGTLPLSYVDYSASMEAQGALKYESFAAFEKLDDFMGGLAFLAMMRLNAGPEIMRYFLMLGQLPELAGFDFFDIDRGAQFGMPPEALTLFAGEFDVAAIDAALTELGYAAQDLDVEGVTAWRRADGQDDMSMDLEKAEPAYPFGGHLGQLRPVAFIPGAGGKAFLVSSASWDVVTNAIAASQGDVSSLADADDYRTLAEAVTAPGQGTAEVGEDVELLVQAQFVETSEVPILDYTDVTRDQWADLEPLRGLSGPAFAPDWCSYAPLPPFPLAIIADRQEGENQVVLLALYYDDTDIAQAAADELKLRLEGFTAYFTRGDDQPLLVEWMGGQGQVETHVYTSDTTGKSAAVVAITYPLPSPEPDEETGLRRDGGLVFKMWLRALMQREMYPFWQITLADWMYEDFCE